MTASGYPITPENLNLIVDSQHRTGDVHLPLRMQLREHLG